MSENLRPVPVAISVSRTTRRLVRYRRALRAQIEKWSRISFENPALELMLSAPIERGNDSCAQFAEPDTPPDA